MQQTMYSDTQIQALTAAIDQNGYAVLPGWASSEQLAQLQAMVFAAVAAAGNSYVALTGSQAVAGTVLHEWGSSPVFLDLCQRIVAAATGRRSKDSRMQQVLRCLTGDRGRRESLIFHYDSYVLTTIMPVCVPEKGSPGDLLMLPSKRPLRSNYVLNVLDKLLVDNRFTQRWLARTYQKKPTRFTQIQMLPGNMYLFWGYRSLHTNLPADPSGVRATAVFHYDNLHGTSSLAGRIRRTLGMEKPDTKPAAMA